MNRRVHERLWSAVLSSRPAWRRHAPEETRTGMPSSEVQQPAYAPVGGEFTQGRPVGIPLHRQRDAQGVVPQRHRRKEWWWQPGPVDSFWYIFPLTCGVFYMAGSTLVWGILVLSGIIWMATTQLPTLQAQYASQCGGAAAELVKCTELADLLGSLSVGRLVPFILIWLLSIVGAMIGLWAVSYSNARGAKLFLRFQALSFAMGLGNALFEAIASSKAKTSEYWANLAFYLVVFAILDLYELKVIWSYQMLLLKRSSRRQAPSSSSEDAAAAERMIELEGSSQVV